MGKNSSTPANIISTPQGGGAVSGIGEKFSPDLFTGTGNFTIPVSLPPGRNDFQPELNLVYSTGNGDGPFGFGWNLSVPGVSRKTSKGVPVYKEEEDTFVLSGAEDLVPVETSEAKTCYRPRTEGLFARITRHDDAENDYWEVRSKDGLTSRYGTSGARGEDPAVVADPSERSKVFSWKLTETADSFGNQILYEYERDAGEDGPHRWDQLYLKHICYVDYREEDTMKFLAGVTFHYEERPDSFSQYRPGFEIRTRKRCTHIETYTKADEKQLIRTYRLRYEALPLNGASLLRQIEVTGHDSEATEALPPLVFGYTQFEPEERDFFPVEGGHLPAKSLGSPDLELADLFGNGLPDILQMNGAARYWRNRGGGSFDRPREMDNAPGGLTLADPGVQLIDADGDGRIDLMVSKDNQSGYFPLQPNGQWDRGSFQRYRQAPSANLQNPEVKMLDLNGDGITDAVRSGSSFECFFNDSEKGWYDQRRVARRQIEDFPDVTFSDARVRWADMTGDGLQDIVLVHDGSIEYWPNLGHGNWGRRVIMRANPRFPYGYDPGRILTGDVDGDGMADLIYVDHGKVTLWINQSGNGWSEPIEITGTPAVSNIDDVRLVDLLGNGVSGLLWSADAQGPGCDHMYFLDFTGGIKPYLLNEMDNNMGAITRVQYTPSTRFYVEDQPQPETRWKTMLPFPVQTVSRVEVIDALSGGKRTTEYRYHHGYWDGDEREFRGFGVVEQFDTETFDDYNRTGLHGEAVNFNRVGEDDGQQFSPPTLKKTWFHQGPVRDPSGDWREIDYRDEYWPDDPSMLDRPEAMTDFLKGLLRRDKRDVLRTLRGRTLRTELYALDGAERQSRPYTVTESLYGVREETPLAEEAGDQQRIFFPHKLARRTTRWERGDDPMTRFSFTEDYDAFGQSRRQTKIACPRDWNHPDEAPGEPYLATRTATTYARHEDANVYIADRVTKTTTFEMENDGSRPLFELKALPDDDPALTVIGQKLNFYDGEAFEGLEPGKLGNFGVLVRSESLVLTDTLLERIYPDGSSPPDENGRPPYLVPGTPEWTAEYPEEFQEQLPERAGYIHREGSESVAGYFAATKQCRYDFQEEASDDKPRGLLKAIRDSLGNETAIEYGVFDLLPVKVKNPAGPITKAEYDYRTLQPHMVTGPNGNRKVFAFTPLGQLKSKAVMGKEGEAAGDTSEVPGTLLAYDFMAFAERGEPVSVRTIKRVHHSHDTDVSEQEQDETINTIEYSDGFGRLLQTRTQGEDVRFGDEAFGGGVLPRDQEDPHNTREEVAGTRNEDPENPNVVVSGWKIYDNKGRVVEQYEPFFSAGWAYVPPSKVQFGQKVRKFYDPCGETVRTVHPDGSEQRVIRGIPDDITDPESFTPTPWETFTYDANDNAGRTHKQEAESYIHHWDTPASSTIDALGRTIETVQRNRALPGNEDDALPAIEELRTRSTYDIWGNLLTQTDALGREAFRHIYDLADNPLRTESIDAGIQLRVLDAAGQEIERCDSKGALILQTYDHLKRPVRVWSRDEVDEPMTLREWLVYGDTPEAVPNEEALSANLLGKPFRHYDEAGLMTFEQYDFKGNLLEKERKVISDETLLEIFSDDSDPSGQIEAFRVDWQPPDGVELKEHAGDLLDAVEYRTLTTYDALNRVKQMRYPEDIAGERKKLQPHYNRSGALQQVTLDDEIYVEHIAYDAKGQRVLMALGNGMMTRYAYDPQTFRLARLRTEGYEKPDDLTYTPAGAPLQDFAYDYDLAGNITAIHDRTPDSGIPGTQQGADVLDRTFTYDPLYRLQSATGRECDRTADSPPWDARPRCTDPTKVRAYKQQYAYDPAGNLKILKHIAEGGRFTRQLGPETDNNRLKALKIGNGSGNVRSFEYTYDACGNLVRENTERHFEWDHSNQMKTFQNWAGEAEPSIHVHYLYDGCGQRVKKLVRKQGGQIESTVYVDGVFEHHRWQQNGSGGENNRLHITDDQKRIAILRVGDQHPDDQGPALQYHLGDHLGSSNLVVKGDGSFISREEYTPYGETSFGSFARKRYRFTGKERDGESGLYYHGARYYVPWLGRWTSCDPAGAIDGLNLYRYSRDNPIRFSDPSGTQSKEQQPNSKSESTSKKQSSSTFAQLFQQASYLLHLTTLREISKTEIDTINQLETIKLTSDAEYGIGPNSMKEWQQNKKTVQDFIGVANEEIKRIMSGNRKQQKLLTSWLLDQWHQALSTTGAYRSTAASYLAQELTQTIEKDRQQMGELGSEYSKQMGALKEFIETGEAGKETKRGVKILFDLKKIGDFATSFRKVMANPRAIENEIVFGVIAKISKKKEVILSGIDMLTSYYQKVGLVGSGHGSMDVLLRDMNNTLNSMKQAMESQRQHIQQRNQAQTAEKLPVL